MPSVTGKIIYEPQRFIESRQVAGRKRINPWWVVVQTGNGLASYYRRQIERLHNPLDMPNGFSLSPPMWGAHVTVLDGRVPVKEEYRVNWKKHDGRKITFDYSPEIYQVWKFFAIPVRSAIMDEIRLECGMQVAEIGAWNYHLTVGRIND